MFAVAVLPALLLGGGMLLLPDTPRWLASRGRWDDAQAVVGQSQGRPARRLHHRPGRAQDDVCVLLALVMKQLPIPGNSDLGLQRTAVGFLKLERWGMGNHAPASF
jgi:Sugar (and other) transporter